MAGKTESAGGEPTKPLLLSGLKIDLQTGETLVRGEVMEGEQQHHKRVTTAPQKGDNSTTNVQQHYKRATAASHKVLQAEAKPGQQAQPFGKQDRVCWGGAQKSLSLDQLEDQSTSGTRDKSVTDSNVDTHARIVCRSLAQPAIPQMCL